MPKFELGKAKWPDFDLSRLDYDAYRKLALVFRCLSLIAHAIGTAKVRVYDELRPDEEIADHPMRRLIRQPNPQMGEARFWGSVALRAGIAGFCVTEKVRDGFGDVVALKPLRSPWLKAKPRGGGVYDWEYSIPGVTPRPVLAAEDAVVFTWADTPDGSPYGLPPLATVVKDVAILWKLTEYLGNLFDSGGVPLYMLIPDPDAAIMDQQELDAWTERFLRRRGGLDRRGVPWYAEGIKDAKPLPYDPVELAMQAVRDFSENDICIAFGVPAHKAGIRLGLEHTSENATAQVLDAAFYRDTIVPLWARFDDALTTGLLPDFESPESTVSLEFDDSDVDALQEDRNAKAAWVVSAFTGGALSHHGFHRELGLPVPETNDFYLRGLATEAIPADDPLQLATTTTTTTPPPALPAGQQGALSALSVVAPTNGHIVRPGPSEAFKRRKAIGAANKRAIVRVADAREPSIARFLSEQADRIAAHLHTPIGVGLARSNGHTTATYAAIDVDWQKENDLLAEVLRSLYALAGSTAFDAASSQLGVGINFDLSNPDVRRVMDKLAHRVVGINETTRQTIAELVTAGEEAGKGASEIAADIRAATAFDAARASAISRTESMMSYGQASALAYRQSGLVDRIQCWDNENHSADYGAEDGLSCAARNGFVDQLDSAELHLLSEHVNGSLAISPVLIGED